MMSEDTPNDGFDYGERRDDGQFERHPTTDQGEFVQPVRKRYVHTEGCGQVTKMGIDLAESFARDPHQYGKTFCAGCNDYFPLDEFHWKGTDQRLDEVGEPEEFEDDTDPEEPSAQELIEAAADHYDADLDQAVTAVDPDPNSSRIYILEEVADGYRLMEYGLEAGYPEEGQPAAEEPMHIPVSAVGEVQGLLHAAGLQQAENHLASDAGDDGLGLREVAEGMGVAEPRGDQ